MARGGYGQGSGVPLHARTRVGSSPVPAPVTGASPSPSYDDEACPARHCWVSVPVDGSTPRPGLLLEWRRVERGRWEGRVVYAALLRPGRWATVEEWLPAELLSGPG